MGKDLNGKELGRGLSQRPDRRYEARAVINGIKIDLYDMLLPNLKKAFEAEKARALRDENMIERYAIPTSEYLEIKRLMI